MSALHYAVGKGFVRISTILVEKGASVKAVDEVRTELLKFPHLQTYHTLSIQIHKV
jgi:hypothetical protein